MIYCILICLLRHFFRTVSDRLLDYIVCNCFLATIDYLDRLCRITHFFSSFCTTRMYIGPKDGDRPLFLQPLLLSRIQIEGSFVFLRTRSVQPRIQTYRINFTTYGLDTKRIMFNVIIIPTFSILQRTVCYLFVIVYNKKFFLLFVKYGVIIQTLSIFVGEMLTICVCFSIKAVI